MTTPRSLQRAEAILGQLHEAETFERHRRVKLFYHDLQWLAEEACHVLALDPIVIPIDAPVRVVGDIHGQFYDLLGFMRLGGLPPTTSYLFLGDYVDRGRNSIETVAYLFALKIRFPQNIWLLRGNHETPDICSLYGFLRECKERYDEGLFGQFVEAFSYLPMAAIIGEKIFCVHGGLSKELTDLSFLKELKRPLWVEGNEMLTDLLWADPNPEGDGYEKSDRGTSYTFGADVVRDFLDKNGFDLICRGHQVVMDGFQFPFNNHTMLTVFSAPNYCEDYGNKGAMLTVDEELRCGFQFIDPPRVRTRAWGRAFLSSG
jgi:serine/threonine-protein phosphatase PP1 catalytic subunit